MKVELTCQHDEAVRSEIQRICVSNHGDIDENLTKDDVVVCVFDDRNNAIRISELFVQAGIVTDIKLVE